MIASETVNGPLVSCVIPCYNGHRYVKFAIESALSQTYQSIEVIVVDDDSTDDTPEILAAYGDRIRVVRQSNAGCGVARNTGAAISSGKYLAWLDSDDVWLPNKIARQVAILEKREDIGQVHTRCWIIDEAGNPPAPVEPFPFPAEIIRDDILRTLVVDTDIFPSSCIVRRSTFEAVGGYNPAYRFSEDWELDLRLARATKFAFLDVALTCYRSHGESMSSHRWPHAVGRLQLQKQIEQVRQELLKLDPSPAMLTAYRTHSIKFADAYYKFGRYGLKNGDLNDAKTALREAIRRNPRVFKHYTRFLWSELLSLRRRLLKEVQQKG
jgi:glycosyltransferase involved in cell wall biosynthesis